MSHLQLFVLLTKPLLPIAADHEEPVLGAAGWQKILERMKALNCPKVLRVEEGGARKGCEGMGTNALLWG